MKPYVKLTQILIDAQNAKTQLIGHLDAECLLAYDYLSEVESGIKELIAHFANDGEIEEKGKTYRIKDLVNKPNGKEEIL